jgi:hypothetical protein
VEDLIMWRDVKKTGMVFGGITLVYLLFEWSGLSLMTIVANVLLVVTLGCLLWANVGSLLGRCARGMRALPAGAARCAGPSSSRRLLDRCVTMRLYSRRPGAAARRARGLDLCPGNRPKPRRARGCAVPATARGTHRGGHGAADGSTC